MVRQPVQDGEAAAYDILLADGRRVMLNEDSDSYVRAGDPRAVSSFELIFAGSKARTPLPPLPPPSSKNTRRCYTMKRL